MLLLAEWTQRTAVAVFIAGESLMRQYVHAGGNIAWLNPKKRPQGQTKTH